MNAPVYSEQVQPHELTFPNPNSEQIGFFGKCEIEIAAGRLLKFCQSRGSWGPHNIGELVDFYRQHDWDVNMTLYGLSGRFIDDCDWISKRSRDYIEFTHAGFTITPAFIASCRTKSPVS